MNKHLYFLMFFPVLAACRDEPLEPKAGTVVLERIEFVRSSARPGETLALTARLAAGEPMPNAPLSVRISTGSASTMIRLSVRGNCPRELTPEEVNARASAWASCSAEGLVAEIARAEGRVFIGFKEADAERGVDARGNVLVSPVTVERMKERLAALGIAVEHEYGLTPAVVAHMPVNPGLVSVLRTHPNVDYLEPVLPGDWGAEGAGLDARSGARDDLVGIVPTAATDGSELRVRVGDLVRATYRQPDGSLLTAQSRIQQPE